MGKNNKVAVYRTGDGRTAMTAVTDEQAKALRETGRLKGVRRVRQGRNGWL